MVGGGVLCAPPPSCDEPKKPGLDRVKGTNNLISWRGRGMVGGGGIESEVKENLRFHN